MVGERIDYVWLDPTVHCVFSMRFTFFINVKEPIHLERLILTKILLTYRFLMQSFNVLLFCIVNCLVSAYLRPRKERPISLILSARLKCLTYVTVVNMVPIFILISSRWLATKMESHLLPYKYLLHKMSNSTHSKAFFTIWRYQWKISIHVRIII